MTGCTVSRLRTTRLATCVILFGAMLVRGAYAQTPPVQIFGGDDISPLIHITKYRSTVWNGVEYIGFTVDNFPPLTGCKSQNDNTWFHSALFIRSTSLNFKSLLVLIVTAAMTGKPIAGATQAG